MGQRSQIYIRIENPLKKEKLGGAIYKDEYKKEAELYFGKGKYSIIPFHHQWLYGMTFVGVLVKIMKEANLAEGGNHPFSPDLTNIPYENWNSDKLKGYGLVEFIQALISIPDFEVSKIGGRFKVESFTYIGDEHYDYDTKKVNRKWANQQQICDGGDNNDGILIIDIPNKKYCFMNPSTHYSERGGRASNLKQLVPASVLEYQRAYYPTVRRMITDYEYKSQCNSDEAQVQELLVENREMIQQIKEMTKDFAVLSLEEVKKIFPKTYKEFELEKARKLAEAKK